MLQHNCAQNKSVCVVLRNEMHSWGKRMALACLLACTTISQSCSLLASSTFFFYVRSPSTSPHLCLFSVMHNLCQELICHGVCPAWSQVTAAWAVPLSLGWMFLFYGKIPSLCSVLTVVVIAMGIVAASLDNIVVYVDGIVAGAIAAVFSVSLLIPSPLSPSVHSLFFCTGSFFLHEQRGRFYKSLCIRATFVHPLLPLMPLLLLCFLFTQIPSPQSLWYSLLEGSDDSQHPITPLQAIACLSLPSCAFAILFAFLFEVCATCDSH